MSSGYDYDVAWIGTGQATMTIVPRLVEAGKRVAVFEGGLFGGTCVNTGCTPTKTLVASATAVQTARRGEDFGFTTEGLSVDFARVMQTQQQNRQSATTSIEDGLNELTGGAVFKDYAQFTDDHTVLANGQKISAETLVIHTGARAAVPDIEGVDSVRWLNNESILDLDVLPEHLAIVGGSYIALEFGQIFHRLGSQVTVLARGSRLVSREDEDISDLVAKRLTQEGIELKLNCSVEAVASGDGIHIETLQNEQTGQIRASHILFATGRRPNSDMLNLSAAGVDTDNRGYISVNHRLQTSASHIYAVGDVNGQGAFTHTSVNDGEIFWDHYSRVIGANTGNSKFDRTLYTRTFIHSMYIDPPLARVGMNESEARNSGRHVLIATMPMADIARAREKRETHGMVKVLVDADSEEILGATVFGTGGDEVIGVFAAFIHMRTSYKHLRRVVLPHPTVGELMPWVLDDLKPLESSAC